jgi:hypothetical protein
MKTITLTRAGTGPKGTFGTFSDAGIPFAVSLELQTPIIPPGSYECDYYYSPARGDWCYRVNGVTGHIGIEIHVANQAIQLLGCIAIGSYFGKSEITLHNGMKISDWGILGSALAFQTLRTRLIGEIRFTLEVK